MKPSKTQHLYRDIFEEIKFSCERKNFSDYRQKGHFYFDKIWRDVKILTRQEAYKWLARILEIKEDIAHFSRLNDRLCKEAIYFCQQLLNDNRRLDLDFGVEPSTPLYNYEAPVIEPGHEWTGLTWKSKPEQAPYKIPCHEWTGIYCLKADKTKQVFARNKGRAKNLLRTIFPDSIVTHDTVMCLVPKDKHRKSEVEGLIKI